MAMLDDKIAIITGTASGMGLAAAQRFLDEGATVVGVDINAEGLDAVPFAKHPRFTARICDISDADSVEALMQGCVADHGRIDNLTNIAGITVEAGKPLHELSLEAWDKVLGVNLRGTFLMMRAAIPHMLAGGGGTITNYASVGAVLASSNHAAYLSSKGGMVQLTKAAAMDYCKRNIRVNCILPGIIDTPRLARSPQAKIAELVEIIPMGRMGRADETSGVAAFLASDDASYCTGDIFPVDGGYLAGEVTGHNAQ